MHNVPATEKCKVVAWQHSRGLDLRRGHWSYRKRQPTRARTRAKRERTREQNASAHASKTRAHTRAKREHAREQKRERHASDTRADQHSKNTLLPFPYRLAPDP